MGGWSWVGGAWVGGARKGGGGGAPQAMQHSTSLRVLVNVCMYVCMCVWVRVMVCGCVCACGWVGVGGGKRPARLNQKGRYSTYFSCSAWAM